MASLEPSSENLGVPPSCQIKTRYWCHAESGCVWTTTGDIVEHDGLVEEISEDTYRDLIKAGFTESVNHGDDLSDILG